MVYDSFLIVTVHERLITIDNPSEFCHDILSKYSIPWQNLNAFDSIFLQKLQI